MVVELQQVAERQHSADALGEHGGNGRPRHADLQHGDEQNVHGHVHETADDLIHHGRFRVAERAYDAGKQVVRHHGQAAYEVDAQVQHGIVEYLGGRLQPG